MWFLIPLFAAVIVLNNTSVVLEYRWAVAGFPINIYDDLLGIGLILALIPFKGGKTAVVPPRSHPLLWPILIVFGAAIAIGLYMASTGLAPMRSIITDARNMAALPLCILIGYRLTRSFAGCKWQVLGYIAAGVAVAILVSLSFVDKGQQVYSARNVGLLREIQYVSRFAGVVAALLLFSVVTDIRFLTPWSRFFVLGIPGLILGPRGAAIAMADICFGGTFASLGRSDWLAAFVAVVMVFALVPRGRRVTGIVITALGIVFLLISLWVGIILVNRLIPGHDLEAIMADRVLSILPWYQRESHRAAAWDTRMPGIFDELALWAHSPIFGNGFGIQDVDLANIVSGADLGASLRHNAWTSTLAATGLVGFSGMVMVFVGMFVAGWRMVKDRLDGTTVLVGALGVLTAVHMAVTGMCTMSFNVQREAMEVGLICGVVLRCRAMQQAVKASVDEEARAPAPEAPYVPWRWPGRASGNV